MRGIAVGTPLLLVAALVAGCGQRGSHSTKPVEPAEASTTAASTPSVSPLQQFQQHCNADQLSDECRALLVTIAQGADADAIPLLCRTVNQACVDASAPVCNAVVEALTVSGDPLAVEALLALEAPPPEATLSAVDQHLLVAAMDLLCNQAPPAAGCQQLVTLLSEAGVAAAVEHQQHEAIRGLVASAAAKPYNEQVPALQRGLPRGSSSIPALLALSSSATLDDRERGVIDRTIIAYGAAARPFLVAALKEEPMAISLRAAHVGWDPGHLEHDDPKRLEGPKRSVEVTDASDHIGKQVRVYHKDGTLREGVLTRIEDDTLYFETRIGGGVITTQIKRSDVERIQF